MNKHILFFNATYIKKLLTLKTAKDLGLTVSVIGPDLPEWSKPYVDHFIEANTYDMEETLSKIKKRHQKMPFDGVITFWDRDVIPVSIVARELGLKGSSIKSAERARNKAEMRECLEFSNVPHPKYKRFSSWDELYGASQTMEYPIIVKPIGASASKGVFKISNPKDLFSSYQMLVQSTNPEKDKMFSFYENEYIVEEFMKGTEVSVEGVISDGSIFWAGITEKWIDTFFEEYQHAFPARLTHELEAEIFNITQAGIEALELDNCGFHAEIMITDDGCKIVEINGRLGGDFITTHLVPLSTGIDITAANLLTVVDEPFNFTPTHDRGSCVKFLIAQQAGLLKEWKGVERVRNLPGVVDFILEKNPGDSIGLPPHTFHDARIAYVITQGQDTQEAIDLADQALSEVSCLIDESKTVVSNRHS